MNKLKKIGITLGILFGSSGIAFAAFLITQNVSGGNNVTSISSALQITNTPINTTGLIVGGSTPNNSLVIKNISANTGDVKLNLIDVVGSLCPDLTLTISGDKAGSFSPMANGSVDLGTIAPGATFNLNQVVSLSSSSNNLGTGCNWNETATFSGN